MRSPNEMVYIVDDDPTVCDALSSLLRANGQNVRNVLSPIFGRSDNYLCAINCVRLIRIERM
jgi:FixJ family two-component response regulator